MKTKQTIHQRAAAALEKQHCLAPGPRPAPTPPSRSALEPSGLLPPAPAFLPLLARPARRRMRRGRRGMAGDGGGGRGAAAVPTAAGAGAPRVSPAGEGSGRGAASEGRGAAGLRARGSPGRTRGRPGLAAAAGPLLGCPGRLGAGRASPGRASASLPARCGKRRFRSGPVSVCSGVSAASASSLPSSLPWFEGKAFMGPDAGASQFCGACRGGTGWRHSAPGCG